MIRVLLFILLFACSYVAPAAAQDKGLPTGNFESMGGAEISFVSQVIDPYTLLLEDGRMIHLVGLNFPDYNPHEPGEISVTALRILRDMLEGREVNLYQTSKKNFGRINRMGHDIAQVERRDDNVWIQGSMVYLGLANVRTTKHNSEMADQLYKFENTARFKKLGLWAVNNFDVIAPKDTADNLESFRIVEGKIVTATLKKNWIYLNFGNDWRTDFTVAISPSDRRTFSEASLDPLQWSGETVRVRGWIVAYNGPYMEINHVQAIELIKDKVDAKDITVETQDADKEPVVKSIESDQ